MNPTNSLNILNGGSEVAVSFLDGAGASIKVRQLPIRLLQRYAEVQGDEAAMVELFCDMPTGWADGLEIQSHEKILRLGEELNTDPFTRWIDRIRERGAKNLALTSLLSSNSPPASSPRSATPAPN